MKKSATKNHNGPVREKETMFRIGRHSVFKLEEAQGLLPLIVRITQNSIQNIERFSKELHEKKTKKCLTPELKITLEGKMNRVIESWQSKLIKLGVKPSGLWLADFDSGGGYFCWKYPEVRIEHWHSYEGGFSNRVFLGELEGVDKIPDFLLPEPEAMRKVPLNPVC